MSVRSKKKSAAPATATDASASTESVPISPAVPVSEEEASAASPIHPGSPGTPALVTDAASGSHTAVAPTGSDGSGQSPAPVEASKDSPVSLLSVVQPSSQDQSDRFALIISFLSCSNLVSIL